MFCVFKRTVSVRWFFWVPQTHVLVEKVENWFLIKPSYLEVFDVMWPCIIVDTSLPCDTTREDIMLGNLQVGGRWKRQDEIMNREKNCRQPSFQIFYKKPGPEVTKLFHTPLNWARNFNCSEILKYWQIKKFLALSLSVVVFIMLINVKMPTAG